MSEETKKVHSPRFGFSSPKLGFSSPKIFHHKSSNSPKVPPTSLDDELAGSESPKEKEKFYSTGRGGAGNIGFGSPSLEPKMVPSEEVIHPLSQEVFTTGRGGAGNMARHVDKETTQKIQDEVHPSIQTDPTKPTMSNMSIGRGGFGNVRATREAVEEEKKSIFEKMKEHIAK